MQLTFMPRYPRSLTQVVGIHSPSEALGGRRIERMEEGLDVLRRAGIRYRFATNALELSLQTSAGTVEQRISDIIELLDAPDVDVLLSSWGGKACVQLLPYLPYELFSKTTKIICGFSDSAVLLNAVTARTGLITFYGPNGAGKLHDSQYGDLRQFRAKFEWKHFNLLSLAPTKVIKEGRARGILFGGNLNCFVLGLVTSDFDLSAFHGGIFFFEDTGLPPRILEQYLVALRNRGFFETVSGVIIGQYAAPPDNDWMTVTSEDMLTRVLKYFDGPIVVSEFFGHSRLPNPAIPIGALAEFNTERVECHVI
jgi:muramoyltetrapeptide carboxypeptidase